MPERNYMAQISSPRNQTPIQKFYNTVRSKDVVATKLKISTDTKATLHIQVPNGSMYVKAKRSPLKSTIYSPNNMSLSTAKKSPYNILDGKQVKTIKDLAQMAIK